MNRNHRAFQAAVIGILVGAATLLAISQARIWGTVKDENDKPIPGVKITVTREGTSFHIEETSGARGDFAITVVDATQTYSYRLDKEGYQSVVETFKVPISSNDRHDFKMLSMAEAERRGPSGRELTPKERAVLIFNEGAEAAQIGDDATARAKFEEAIGLDGELAAAFTALALLDFGDKEWAKSVEHADRALALDPNDTKALRVLVESYTQLGDDAKAKAASDRLVQIDPKAGAGDLYRDGVREYNAGNTDAAAKFFEQALAIDAGHARSHYMLGLCLSGSDGARAKEHFETFIRLAPNDPDAATAQEMIKYLK